MSQNDDARRRTPGGQKDREARAAIKAIGEALAALSGLPSEPQHLVNQAVRLAAEIEA